MDSNHRGLRSRFTGWRLHPLDQRTVIVNMVLSIRFELMAIGLEGRNSIQAELRELRGGGK